MNNPKILDEVPFEVIGEGRALLGEGPVWDEKRQRLYWVDILERRIYRYDPAGNAFERFELPQYVGALALRERGGLVLALQDGFHFYDPDEGRLERVHDPEPDLPDNRFNDGKCDPAGRFWAGTMSLSGREQAGSLYRLDPDGRVSRMLEKVSISNGLAWSGNGTTMYFIDTPTRCVRAFDYDAEDGSIRNGRVVLRFAEEEGSPDGMTIDEEGMLWIAFWGGHRVGRWDPRTGRRLKTLALPVPLVTSCTFGGERMNELYVTTARAGLSDEELARYPLSGALFRITLDVRGAPAVRFRG